MEGVEQHADVVRTRLPRQGAGLIGGIEQIGFESIYCFKAEGNAVGGDEPYGINFGENWVSVDPSVDYDETRDAIIETIADDPVSTSLMRSRRYVSTSRRMPG